jgi:hypothetical protein
MWKTVSREREMFRFTSLSGKSRLVYMHNVTDKHLYRVYTVHCCVCRASDGQMKEDTKRRHQGSVTYTIILSRTRTNSVGPRWCRWNVYVPTDLGCLRRKTED